MNVILPMDKMTFPGMPVREDVSYKSENKAIGFNSGNEGI
jgi:hypothetical protein